MFLMNVPPVLALQSKWEAFGPSGSFRFPGCFSESTEGVARAAVSTKVQMVISTLQSDRATLGMSNEHTTRKSHRGERCRDTRLASNPAVPKEQPTFTACAFTADFNPTVEEAAVDFGPLALDSDSDDSVDRDIEEAIQEYLKAKSSRAQPMSSGSQPMPSVALPSGATEGSSRGKPEPPQNSTMTALCPAKPRADNTVAGGVPDSHTGARENRGPASPVSVSSDDSFEQSIQAEIEQFLNEKKQHEIQKCDASVDKKPDPGEISARLALQSSKEPATRVHRQDTVGAGKEFVFRKQKTSVQPRGLKAKVTIETEALSNTKPAAPKAASYHLSDTTQNKGGTKKIIGAGRRGKQAKSAALVSIASDSSSDDGIEEAIQLYQLEKTRKEASGDAPQRGQLREDQGPDSSASNTSTSTKSAFPETHRKTASKKKLATTKAMEVDPHALDSSYPTGPPKETKASPQLGDTGAKGECADQASCRADTSAELMCAEAILDISKTILPVPSGASARTLHTSPLFYAPSVPSRSDGDSSSVDSDDSIEQEIRTFLALKAQSGSLLAQAENHPPPAWSPRLSPGPNSQAGGPLSKTLDVPLSCKRKHRGSGSTAKPSALKKSKEVAKEDSQDADHCHGSTQPGHEGWDIPSQGRAGEAAEAEARSQPLPSKAAGPGDELVASDVRGGMSHSHGQVDEARGVGEKGSSDDKSSSLDSDEDLDTAIKDLLRSKRKLKRRCREPRAATCKKRVRFSTTETQGLETGSSFQKDWRNKSPCLLKSCLSKSRKDSREITVRRPGVGDGIESTVESVRTDGTSSGDPPLSFQLRKKAPEGSLFCNELEVNENSSSTSSPISLSDDSSSVDSDDSIELEIRKFLAEKAKESMNCTDIHGGGPLTPRAGGLPRPEPLGRKESAVAPTPGVCTWTPRSRAASQLAEGPRSTERATGGQSMARVFSQGAKGLPAAQAPCEPAPPKNASGTLSAKGSPISKRNAYGSKDQNQRGVEPTAVESAFQQLPSGAIAGAEDESTSAFQVSRQSLSLLTPSPGAERESRVLLSGQPQADSASPWSDFAQQSRLQSTWALHPDAAWKGGFGTERDSGAEGPAKCPSGLALDSKKSLPFAGFAPLLSTQLFHFGKSVSWGGEQASLFSPRLGLPLQGPSFSAFREVPLGPSPVFGSSHLLVKKEGGHWQSRKSPVGLGLPDRRISGSEENVLDLRYRRRAVDRDDEDQEALGSDASDFSDTSMEDGSGSGVVKGNVLQL
ncbi:protein phosphatase 1 regulatory subunit 26 [Orycteropus afer afer]|uniref:Protein phosphatase 1 regulatory subunit 26 n=1 Tax=Orycteropus afer afer TaxID=1230840 RepID=A0A8B7B1I1_ORYAF|nr:protein phosphatase 1 regulatory subunit 26 [Orycteropus afer afer]